MNLDIILSIALAIGLAAACGFRVFLPLFAISLMSYFGMGTFGLADHFEWIGSLPAVIAFGGASLLELAGYYIPYVDNLLDTIAIPLAAAAGTLISLSTMVDMDPLATWSIALIAGGGLAGLIKGAGSAVRASSTVTTAGIANPVVSTMETGASIGMILLALFVPIMALLAIVLIVYLLFRAIRKFSTRRRTTQDRISDSLI